MIISPANESLDRKATYNSFLTLYNALDRNDSIILYTSNEFPPFYVHRVVVVFGRTDSIRIDWTPNSAINLTVQTFLGDFPDALLVQSISVGI